MLLIGWEVDWKVRWSKIEAQDSDQNNNCCDIRNGRMFITLTCSINISWFYRPLVQAIMPLFRPHIYGLSTYSNWTVLLTTNIILTLLGFPSRMWTFSYIELEIEKLYMIVEYCLVHVEQGLHMYTKCQPEYP